MKPIYPRINPLERLIILSAGEDGCIDSSDAKINGLGKYAKVLGLLEKLDVLRKDSGGNSYHLTGIGMKLRAGLRTATA